MCFRWIKFRHKPLAWQIIVIPHTKRLMLAIELIWSYGKFWINTMWRTLVQLLHYILKCIHLEWRSLFGLFRYILIQTVRLIVLIISIPHEDLFSETAVWCTASYFVKIIWCSRWLCYPPSSILRLCFALFAVAEGWLLFDIGWFALFFCIWSVRLELFE